MGRLGSGGASWVVYGSGLGLLLAIVFFRTDNIIWYQSGRTDNIEEQEHEQRGLWAQAVSGLCAH